MPINNALPGFVDLDHLDDRRVVEVGWDVVTDAVRISAQIHTEQMQAVMGTFVRMTDPNKPRIQVNLPVATELQPLQGEDDSPVPVRGFDKYVVAFPLRDAGFAWGNNRKSRVKMTVQEANDITRVGLVADAKWLRRHALTAILNNTSYTFTDDEYGDLTIKPLANGDADKYNFESGDLDVDDHYLAQAAAIDDNNNPFPTIYNEITEHPLNDGEVVVYVSTSLVAAIRALTNFVPYYEDQRIRPGGLTEIVTSFPTTLIGDRNWGEVDGCYIKEWKSLPPGYMVFHTPMTGPFLGMREEPEPELKGLRPETYLETNQHAVYRLLRTAGFGAINRTAAGVYYVGGANYTSPPGYTVVPVEV